MKREKAQRSIIQVLIVSLVLSSIMPALIPRNIAVAKPPEPRTEASDPSKAQGVHPQAVNTLTDFFDFGDSIDLGDPIAASSGAFHWSMEFFKAAGPSDIGFEIIYRTDMLPVGPIDPVDFPDPFWWNPRSLVHCADVGEPVCTIQMNKGNLASFKLEGGDWTLIEPDDFGRDGNGTGIRYVLKETEDYYYFMDPVAQKVHIYEKVNVYGRFTMGRTVRVLDRNGNALLFSYAEADDNNPIRVEDGLGRSLDFSYDVQNAELDRVTDQGGRQVTFAYDQGPDNDGQPTLRSITDPLGNTTNFSYIAVPDPQVNWNHAHNITAVTHPAGNIAYTQAYTITAINGINSVRVAEQTDAYDNTTSMAYATEQSMVTETRPDDSEVTYEHYGEHGKPESMTDAAGNTLAFTNDEQLQTGSILDRDGNEVIIDYHDETGMFSSMTTADGNTLAFTYSPQDQVFTNPLNDEQITFTFYVPTRIDYPDNTFIENIYDINGNVTSYKAQNGQTWLLQRNQTGLPTQIINPTGGIISYTYNPDGSLASSSDSASGVTTYEYDIFTRVTLITDAEGNSKRITYNLNDQITSVADENGGVYRYTYDVNGNLVQANNPLGGSVSFTYDLMDRKVEREDWQGKITRYEYNELGQKVSTIRPDGNRTTYEYNPLGKVSRRTDPSGFDALFGYNNEGQITSMTTPLGFTTTYDRDALGMVDKITNSLGRTTSYERDERSRVIAVTDALNRTTRYDYDALGLLSSVTLPGGGVTAYERNPSGLLQTITDMGGKQWQFGHSAEGRIASVTDPLGNRWQYEYDQLGHLASIIHPDGETQDWSYDVIGNPILRQHSDDSELFYTYDALNLLVASDGITLTHNAMGQIVSTTDQATAISFDAAYDNADRIETVSYADGLFSVTYEWDARDLLIRVSDTLTGVSMMFEYDDDGRLIETSRSNDVDTVLTWNPASELVHLQEGTLVDLQYTYDDAGQVIGQQGQLPLDPAIYLIPSLDVLSYDDASRVNSEGYRYNQRGQMLESPEQSYNWNGAGRLSATADASFTYNGLQDVMTRHEGEQAIRYYYHYGFPQRPIMAERNEETGAWLRFYVLQPNGNLLYMIDAADDNQPYFYHYDKSGNTLFLSDDIGAMTDAYAYTPFGRLLAHEGENQQPYTFSGAFQARREGNQDLYQMHYRYYDADTAHFISKEPLWPALSDPKQLNPYQYALADPIRYSDPSGLLFDDGSFNWDGLFDGGDNFDSIFDDVGDWFDDVNDSLGDLAEDWGGSFDDLWNNLAEDGWFDFLPDPDPGEIPDINENVPDPDPGPYANVGPMGFGAFDAFINHLGQGVSNLVFEYGPGLARNAAIAWSVTQIAMQFSPYGAAVGWIARIIMWLPEGEPGPGHVPGVCYEHGWARCGPQPQE